MRLTGCLYLLQTVWSSPTIQHACVCCVRRWNVQWSWRPVLLWNVWYTITGKLFRQFPMQRINSPLSISTRSADIVWTEIVLYTQVLQVWVYLHVVVWYITKLSDSKFLRQNTRQFLVQAFCSPNVFLVGNRSYCSGAHVVSAEHTITCLLWSGYSVYLFIFVLWSCYVTFYLRPCSHLVPEHSGQTRLSLGTIVNTSFLQGPTPEVGQGVRAQVQGRDLILGH